MTETSTAPGRDRLASFGAPRASAIPEAQRHSARVARMRRFIRWGVGGILGIVAIGAALQALRSLPLDVGLGNIALKGTKITIATPKIVGYRPDGRPFEITAKEGVQDITKPDLFELEGLQVDIANTSDSFVRMTAGTGVYNAKTDSAALSSGVSIRDEKTFDMRLASAQMDFKASVMRSKERVKLTFEGGETTAASVEFSAADRRGSFVGAVHSTLYGEQDEAPAARPVPAPQPTGK